MKLRTLTTRHRRNRGKAYDYAREVERQGHRMVRAARDVAIRQRDEYAELVDALRAELAATRRSLAEHADGMRAQRETIDGLAAENQRIRREVGQWIVRGRPVVIHDLADLRKIVEAEQ